MTSAPATDPPALERPHSDLLRYYALIAILTGPAFPITFLPLLCKYLTLRYRLDDKGISASWGVLFHKEIYLTYRRIQDIHVMENVIQRWLGLASITVQTASGAGGSDLVIEGFKEPARIRDFLYGQMRGAKHPHESPPLTALAEAEPGGDATIAGVSLPSAASILPSRPEDEALRLLREIHEHLRRLRESGTKP